MESLCQNIYRNLEITISPNSPKSSRMEYQSGSIESPQTTPDTQSQQSKTFLGVFNQDSSTIGNSLKRPSSPKHQICFFPFPNNFNTQLSRKTQPFHIQNNHLNPPNFMDTAVSFKDQDSNTAKLDISIISLF